MKYKLVGDRVLNDEVKDFTPDMCYLSAPGLLGIMLYLRRRKKSYIGFDTADTVTTISVNSIISEEPDDTGSYCRFKVLPYEEAKDEQEEFTNAITELEIACENIMKLCKVWRKSE